MATSKAGGGTIQIRQFNGGMITDPRDPTANKFLFGSNFDFLTQPFKMVPYQDSINGDTDSSADQIRNFCVALGASSTYNVYGLGTNGSVAEVFYKHANTNGSPDLGEGAWGTTGNNEGSSQPDYRLFAYYPTEALIYGANSGG